MSGVGRAYNTLIGPFFQAVNITTNETDIDLSLVGATSAGRFTFPRQSNLLGFVREQDAAISAGTLTIRILKNGVSATTVALTTGQRGFSSLSTGVSFAAGDGISFQYTTDGSIAGLTNILVFPVFNMQ